MTYVPVPNTAMAELRFLYDGQQIENTLYFHFIGPPDASDMLPLGDAIIDWWITNMAPLLVGGISLREVFLTALTTATSATASATTLLPAAGAISEEGMPGNCSPCISFRTNSRGRSFRGRNYIAGISANMVALSTFEQTWADNVIDAYAQLRIAASDLDYTQVVVSRFSGHTVVGGKKIPTPRTTGLATPVISASFTDLTIDSQRGRLPNH